MSKQDADHIDELQAELKAREREAAKTRGELLQAKKEIQTMALRVVPQVQTVESAEGLLKLQQEHKVALETIMVNPPARTSPHPAELHHGESPRTSQTIMVNPPARTSPHPAELSALISSFVTQSPKPSTLNFPP
jgi:hypothetical protein